MIPDEIAEEDLMGPDDNNSDDHLEAPELMQNPVAIVADESMAEIQEVEGQQHDEMQLADETLGVQPQNEEVNQPQDLEQDTIAFDPMHVGYVEIQEPDADPVFGYHLERPKLQAFQLPLDLYRMWAAHLHQP